MASTSDIRKGLCIRFNNDIYKIIEFLHVKPGKGPAFVRTKLKSVTTGKVLDNTFSAGHKLDDVRVETRSFQFLYSEGSTYHFMNTEDYDQITLQEEALEAHDLLKEGEVVTILFNTEDSAPLSVDMPASVVCRTSVRRCLQMWRDGLPSSSWSLGIPAMQHAHEPQSDRLGRSPQQHHARAI